MRHPATSLRPGWYSATTAMPLWTTQAFHFGSSALALPSLTPKQDSIFLAYTARPALINPAPYDDYKVVRFRNGLTLCRDTFQQAPIYAPGTQAIATPSMPGIVHFTVSGLGIDEAEISNLDWQQFEQAQLELGADPAGAAPNLTALTLKDYYTSPFYRFYPVVGISYEQAQRFCQWRSDVVNAQLLRSSDARTAGFICQYRLPTEAEWEEAAAVRSGQPYGTPCTKLRVQVAPAAAAYLQKRANSTVGVAKIKSDIEAYNRAKPVRSWINYAQSEPYFLRLVSPAYIYQGPANYFGLYQMLGNAAEMVQERGLTKGGSYQDALEACQIKARGTYSGPAPTIGFRTVCTVSPR